jgi:cell division transport system permease protein
MSDRPQDFDDLGLQRGLGDRMLPLIVAAMAFLAALALAGSVGAAALARHWQAGAAAALTVQVPRPTQPASDASQPRVDRVVSILRGTPGIVAARALGEDELLAVLRPWLGNAAGHIALPLPAVVEVQLAGPELDLPALSARLEAAAPGTLAEDHGVWVRRLSALARSLEACAWAALLVVALVAVAVVAVATRAGLSARRQAIEIVHGLGATDGYIAARFAGRATTRATLGAAAGAFAALPALLVLADLAAPFADALAPVREAAGGVPLVDWAGQALAAMPPALWLALPGLPFFAALIGFATAQATVRRWLRQLP